MWNSLCRVAVDSLLLQAIIVLPAIMITLLLTVCANSIRNSICRWIGVDAYIRLTFPGVIVHELGHMLFCIIFGHKIIDYKLFSPEADGTLGYVNHSYNPGNFYHRIGNFFIGTGPVWFGLALIYLLSAWLLPELPRYSNDTGKFSSLLPCALEVGMRFLKIMLTSAFWFHWQSWLWLVLVLTIGSHIALSPPDFSGAADGFVVLMVFLFAVLALIRILFGFDRIFLQKLALSLSMFYGVFIFLSTILLFFTVVFFFIGLSRIRKHV